MKTINESVRYLSGASTIKRVLVASVFVASAAAFSGCNQQNGASTGGATGTQSSNTSFSSSDAVATVNGENITRGQLYNLLSASGGDQVLNVLIRERALMQELKKNNLEVTDAEVDEFIQAQKLANPQQAAQIDEVVKGGGPKLDALRFQARQTIATNKLLTKDIKVDEAKLKAWFEKNRARYNVPENIKVGLLASSTKARADTMAQQLKSKTKTFTQLVDDQKKANDPQAQSSTATDGPNGSRTELVKLFGPKLGPALQKIPIGGSSPVLLAQDKPPAYVILGIVSGTPAQQADLAKMRSKVESDYKLEQVARTEIQKTGNKQPFETVVKQYETGMQQGAQGQPGQPGGRPVPYSTVLAALTQGKTQEIQQNLTKDIKVEIKDPDLVEVGEQFKPSPTPPAAPGSSPAASPAASPAG